MIQFIDHQHSPVLLKSVLKRQISGASKIFYVRVLKSNYPLMTLPVYISKADSHYKGRYRHHIIYIL